METFKLPVGNFKWVKERELKSWTAKDILQLPSQSDIGYAFECDLVYPKKYHKVSVAKKGKKKDIQSYNFHDPISERRSVSFSSLQRRIEIQTFISVQQKIIEKAQFSRLEKEEIFIEKTTSYFSQKEKIRGLIG